MRALQRAGFVLEDVRGSHHQLRTPRSGRPVVIPVHGSTALKPGTLRGVIRDAGMSVDEFRGLLK